MTKHQEIISMLKYAAKQFELEIPEHWLWLINPLKHFFKVAVPTILHK